MAFGRYLFACVVFCVPLAACGDDGSSGSGMDGGDAGGGVDASTTGDAGGEPCSAHADCDDGVFCNGRETCAPASPDADSRGCVAAAEERCLAGQTCDEDSDSCLSDCDVTPDADGDGHDSMDCGGDDCDDADALRYPGNAEICDAEDRDEDCDPSTYGIRDGDSDGEPDATCCNGDNCGTDCDDTRAGVNPTVSEVCNGIDDDCDEMIDEGVEVPLYYDGDGDMYGDASMTMMGCPDMVPDYVADDTDCNDAEATIHPGALDTCDDAMVDEDCNGTPNDPPGGCDCTGTMSRGCTLPGICADGTEMCLSGAWGDCSISPEPYEVCDMEDDDCNGVVDDGLRRDCWPDGDGDGYAAAGTTSSSECATPGGGCPSAYTTRAPTGSDIDCDEPNPARSPGVTETCNGIDDDCDSMVDEALTVICFRDEDNDTYAPSTSAATNKCPDDSRTSVGLCPIGWTNRSPTSALTTDCNDDTTMSGGTVYPGAPESCDGIDNDCDGTIDDGAKVTCWADGDDDGFALPGAETMMLCRDASRPSRGYCPYMWTARDPAGGTTEQDCNDGDPATFPGAPELCGAGDNDCDGTTADETTVTCYTDTDNDNYAASSATPMEVCPDGSRVDVGYCPSGMTDRAPSGTDSIDCAPMDASRHPGVTETCDEPTFVDSNCNGNADEGNLTCWRDNDDDGWALAGASTSVQCLDTARDGYPHYGCATGWTGRNPDSDPDRDCNDSSATYHTIVHCYPDADNDSYRSPGSSSSVYCYSSSAPGYGGCPSGRTVRSSPTDCCEADGRVHPNQTTYYSTPRNSACGSPSYDYDCNGSNNRRWTASTNSVSCGSASTSGACSTVSSSVSAGWLSTVPGCGSSAFWRTGCDWYIDPMSTIIRYCEPDGFSRTQKCR